MEITERPGGVRDLLVRPPSEKTMLLAWLGQAGFALRSAETLLLVDPYLSDSLAEKYRGREFPHLRMMRPPVEPQAVRGVDWVLCTHRHSDHMDPGTLPVIAGRSPGCRFLVPKSELARAAEIGLPEERTVGIDAGERRALAEQVEVLAVPAAHETIETDDAGHCRYLGYVIRMGTIAIYHSGDTVPYEGLAAVLDREGAAVALLPVNGRDAYRRSRGVPGNMTFDEAAALCREAHIGWMVVHHFGMFEFNTVDPHQLQQQGSRLPPRLRCIVPEVDMAYGLCLSAGGR